MVVSGDSVGIVSGFDDVEAQTPEIDDVVIATQETMSGANEQTSEGSTIPLQEKVVTNPIVHDDEK